MNDGTLVGTVGMPVGIAELVTRTDDLTREFGAGLVAIQYDEATLGIFTPGDIIECPTCQEPLDGMHQTHPYAAA